MGKDLEQVTFQPGSSFTWEKKVAVEAYLLPLDAKISVSPSFLLFTFSLSLSLFISRSRRVDLITIADHSFFILYSFSASSKNPSSYYDSSSRSQVPFFSPTCCPTLWVRSKM
jgi:hypothetical protein